MILKIPSLKDFSLLPYVAKLQLLSIIISAWLWEESYFNVCVQNAIFQRVTAIFGTYTQFTILFHVQCGCVNTHVAPK